MKIILYISDYVIPLTIFYIVGFGLLMKRPVYDDFVKGAKEGAKTVAGIMPTLVGLRSGGSSCIRVFRCFGRLFRTMDRKSGISLSTASHSAYKAVFLQCGYRAGFGYF